MMPIYYHGSPYIGTCVVRVLPYFCGEGDCEYRKPQNYVGDMQLLVSRTFRTGGYQKKRNALVGG
jgi:hypothetical protein